LHLGHREGMDQRLIGFLLGYRQHPAALFEARRDAVFDESHKVSLSRLNHWLPRSQAHPEIVQGTAELHHEIADALLPQADPVFHNATTLDAAVDMLDPQPPLVERLVGPLLLQGQLLTAWLLRRHEDLHLRERERQEAQ